MYTVPRLASEHRFLYTTRLGTSAIRRDYLSYFFIRRFFVVSFSCC